MTGEEPGEQGTGADGGTLGGTQGGRVFLPGTGGTFLAATTPSIPYAVIIFFRFAQGEAGSPRNAWKAPEFEAMPAASNLSSTRRTIKALRRSERITEANIALAQLALTTARSLDEVVASGERHYVVDRLARAHLFVLKALAETPEPDGPDPFGELLTQMMAPTPGTPEEPTSDRF